MNKLYVLLISSTLFSTSSYADEALPSTFDIDYIYPLKSLKDNETNWNSQGISISFRGEDPTDPWNDFYDPSIREGMKASVWSKNNDTVENTSSEIKRWDKTHNGLSYSGTTENHWSFGGNIDFTDTKYKNTNKNTSIVTNSNSSDQVTSYFLSKGFLFKKNKAGYLEVGLSARGNEEDTDNSYYAYSSYSKPFQTNNISGSYYLYGALGKHDDSYYGNSTSKHFKIKVKLDKQPVSNNDTINLFRHHELVLSHDSNKPDSTDDHSWQYSSNGASSAALSSYIFYSKKQKLGISYTKHKRDIKDHGNSEMSYLGIKYSKDF